MDSLHPGNASKPPSTTPISDIATPQTANAVLGKLKVRIVEATGLKVFSPVKSSPYVVCSYDSSEFITHTAPTTNSTPAASSSMSFSGITSTLGIAIPLKSKRSNAPTTSSPLARATAGTGSSDSGAPSLAYPPGQPRWKDEGQFDVISEHAGLNISIYDAGHDHVFLGQVSIHPDLSGKFFFDQWLRLEARAHDAPVTGEVRVQLSYERIRNRRIGPNDFDILRLVGKGTFGHVYQVRKKDTNRIYAMKILSKKVIVQKKEVAHTIGERDILVRTALADSNFIVGLKFSFQTLTDLYLVTDYMSGGELFWHLQKEGRFSEERAKFYIAELIIALEHLHNNDIVYRDLKPENILLDANGHIALCDFGLSKANVSSNGTTNTFCGTTEYLAPEVLLDDKGYTKMVDFWSLGVLVFEMCCGWSPFYADDTQQMYKNIAFGKVRFPKDALSPEGRNFVKGLLNRNPLHRLGSNGDALELQAHPFFHDVDWKLMAAKQIQPPFKPHITGGETDTSNFDPEFTQASTSVMKRGLGSTPLSPGIQANFEGFTYVGESNLDETYRQLGTSFRGTAPSHFHDDDIDLYDDNDIENTVKYNNANGLSNNELLKDDYDVDVGMEDYEFVNGQQFEM
jgi:protein-serine/threonine kinase